MAFGGAGSAASGSLTLTGVSAGATILVSVLSANAIASAFAVSDAQGSYTAVDSIVGTGTGAVSSQVFILTNANSGSHAITATATGDTVVGIQAVWYTSVGGVDNSGGAHNASLNTSTGTGADVCTSGTFTTTTAGTTVVGFFWDDNLVAFSAGTSPNAFTSRQSGTASDTFITEDFSFAGSGSVAATAGKASNSTYVISQGIALAPGLPSISVQPANVQTYPGVTATFSVTAAASSGSLSYQWQQFITGSWTNIGTNANSYTTPTLSFSDNGETFRVQVTDSNGTVTSTVATLTVFETANLAWVV
jgi:hypothetical protein